MQAEWLTHFNPDPQAIQYMGISLDAAHVALDVFPSVPVIDQDSLRKYNEMDVKIMDAPKASTHLKSRIMLGLQRLLLSYSSADFKARML